MDGGAGFFDAINARFIEPAQVGRNFILPMAQFSKVTENNNTVVIGPRGSGKTTLLKMLRLPAMAAWRHEKRPEFIKALNFTAVYIGAQRSVAAILSNPNIGETSNVRTTLLRAVLLTNLMFSFLDAIQETSDLQYRDDELLSKFYAPLTLEEEIELLDGLSLVWRVPTTAKSRLQMRAFLSDRLNIISEANYRFQIAEEGSDLESLVREPFYRLSLDAIIKGTIELVNEVMSDPHRKWAICFDEIEILDRTIQLELFGCLRSIDQRAILKLAASPFSSIPSDAFASTRPEGGHDFIPLVLSHARKRDAMRFSEHLFKALLAEQQLAEVTPDDVLGKSQITDDLRNDSVNPYKPPRGRNYQRMAELKRKDPTFAAYLTDRSISLETVWSGSESDRAGEARKFLQIVGIRLEYGRNNVLNADGHEVRRFRSRKAIPDFYLGSEALLTLCEGNPRILIGLLRPLVLRYAIGRKRVSNAEQSVQVSTTIARYLSLLSALPVYRNRKTERADSLVRILDRIGDYFFLDVVGGPFKPEPVTTFIVDRGVPQYIADAIGVALNQGALVFIPSKQNEFVLGDVRGRRYRLSYLLAARYHLPLTYGSQINLSSVLRGDEPRTGVTYNDLFSAS